MFLKFTLVFTSNKDHISSVSIYSGCHLVFGAFLLKAVTWLNFSNCTFDPRTDYMFLGIKFTDENGCCGYGNKMKPGYLTGIWVLKMMICLGPVFF